LRGGGVVAVAPGGVERGGDFYDYFVVAAVVAVFEGFVVEQVLAVEGEADGLGGIGKLGAALDEPGMAAGFFGEGSQQVGTAFQLGDGSTGVDGVDKSHGVNADAGFAHGATDVGVGVAAAVVAAVGDDEQGFAGGVNISHAGETVMHGVEERGLAAGVGPGRVGQNIGRGGRQIGDQARMLIEFEEAIAIVIVCEVEELLEGRAEKGAFTAHAGADIGEDANLRRGVFGGDGVDGLFDTILIDAETAGGKVHDRAIRGVGDGHRDFDERSADTQVGAHASESTPESEDSERYEAPHTPSRHPPALQIQYLSGISNVRWQPLAFVSN
jgi:hypothetical protein